jgi:hypothetical protein
VDTLFDPFIESVGSRTDNTPGATEYSMELWPGGAAGFCHPQVEGQKAMSDNRTIITLPPYATNAIMDAVQRAIIDKGASKATRKAAFSALLALVDAGLIKGSVSANSLARDETGAAQTPVGTRWLLAGPG